MPSAFVLLRAMFGAEGDLLEALRGIEGVEDVYLVEGVYNLVARVKAETMDGLREITWSIRRLDGVKSAMVLIVTGELAV